METLEPALNKMTHGDQLLKDEFYAVFEMMYDRKQHLFFHDNRFIVDYQLEENDEGLHLQVASTQL